MMFGLTDAQYNVVKAQAKKANTSIKDAIDKSTRWNDIAGPELRKAHDPVQTLVTYWQFMYICGMIEGRWGKSADYE